MDLRFKVSPRMNSQLPTNDIECLYDLNAIKKSIFNAFNTTPGQKLLNPYYGLNLSKYLFKPVSEDTGKQISDTIFVGLPQHEPRVKVINVKVVGDPEANQYDISFVIVFPNLNNNNRTTIRGILNRDTFNIT